MKKILYGILAIIFIWIILFVMDYGLSLNNQKPLISWKQVEYTKEDTYFTEYYSLGYKVIKEEKGWIKSFSMKPLWVKTAPDRKFVVIDETEGKCASGKSYIYEDQYFQYYFSCNRKIFIQIDNEKLSITTALESGKVTVSELLEAGVPILKEGKIDFTFEITPDSSCNYLEGDSSKLVKQKEGLYYYCLNKANIFVNRNYSTFKEAFNNTIKTDSITIMMNKELVYESGAILYQATGYRMLVCSNGNVILGSYNMEYFDIFNDICS